MYFYPRGAIHIHIQQVMMAPIEQPHRCTAGAVLKHHLNPLCQESLPIQSTCQQTSSLAKEDNEKEREHREKGWNTKILSKQDKMEKWKIGFTASRPWMLSDRHDTAQVTCMIIPFIKKKKLRAHQHTFQLFRKPKLWSVTIGFIAWFPWFPFTPPSHYVISCPSHAELISLGPITLPSIITSVYVLLCFGLCQSSFADFDCSDLLPLFCEFGYC